MQRDNRSADDPKAAGRSPARGRNLLIPALIAIGIALRVWQYLADMSFWFDELSIARNIHERSLATLLSQPLGYDQIAPPGFIALVKLSTLLFGRSEMALRLFPFLCGIASLFLFWRLAARALDGVAVPIAVALFAIGIPFIRYTAELGEMRHLHASSLGKALLGQMPPKERSALLDKLDMARLTPDTVTSRAKLEAEIAKSLKRGWYANSGESVEHIFAVAVAANVNGDHYAISLPGPMERMKPNLKHLVARLESARKRIEAHDGDQ